MVRIIFIRHGESESNEILYNKNLTWKEINTKLNNIVDPKLTEIGIQQAVQTANYLLTLNIENYEIITSRYSRTLQTANEFVKNVNKTVIVDDDLYEYTPSDRKKSNLHKIEDKSFEEFTKIVKKFINKIETYYNNNSNNIIIYGHSLFLAVMLTYISSNKKFIPRKNDITYSIPNCSLTIFSFNSNLKWKIHTVGNINHLSLINKKDLKNHLIKNEF